MELKMEVYTPSLELAGALEEYQSVIWEDKAFTAGSFSVEALLTSRTQALLREENILWIGGGTAGMIEHYEKTAENGAYVTIKGRLLTGILDQRILWGLYDMTGTPPEIMHRLVGDCAVNPTRGDTEARKIPGLVLLDPPAGGGEIRMQKTGGSLLEALETIGAAYRVAFGVRFNPAYPRMEFWTRWGTNRSVSQDVNAPVFYSTELDDVLRSEYSYDSTDYRNVALVAGEGEGKDRTMVTVEAEMPETPDVPDTPTPPEPQKVTITLAVDPQGGGTAYGGGYVTAGSSVTITAAAAEGYDFTGWREDGEIVSTNVSYTFTAAADRTLTAVFAASVPVYTVQVAVDPAGSGTVSGAGTYQEGDTVTITATPGEGYKFTGWQENGTVVSTDETYTFTASGNVSLTAVFESVPVSKLPEGYTEVEYIESNGTQYIDTGIKPITTTRIAMDVAPTVAGSSSAKFFISSHFFPSNSSYKYALRILWDNGGVKASMVRYSSAVSSTTLSSNTALRRMLLEMDVSKKTASVDGVSKTFSDTTISTGLSNILLLTYNKSSAYAVSAKTYSCQIYTGDDITRDFVPCINPSGTAGLYDLVGKAFYANGGTGTFTAGPAV